MGGSPAPKDNSVELMRMEQQAAREAEERRRQEAAQQRSDFDNRLNSAYNNALGDAEMFFSSRGLDPSQYMSNIQQQANRMRGNVPLLAETPGSYFDNIGATVYDQLSEAQRNQYMRSINNFAGQDFATRRISNDTLNPTVEAILNEQRGSADQYLRNLLDRGVITNTGFQAGQNDINNQGYGARSRLNEVAMGLVESGRSGANDIANNARRAAESYQLGDTFDPYAYSSDLDNYFSNYFNNLGSNFRAQAPSNLFNTAGLAGIAGAAQGAGNTSFDPGALAGIFGDNDETEQQPRSQLSAF